MPVKNILLCSIFFIASIVSASANCDACLQGICYSEVIVWDNYNGSGRITVDTSTNTLYLQHKDSSDGYVNIGYGLDDGEIEVIPDIPMISTTRAVDPITGRVFIGTTRGLHEYNRFTKQTRFLGLADETIYNAMHFVKKLYYSRLPFGLCTIDNDYIWNEISVLTWISVDDFVVDKNDDIYYRSGARISRLAKDSSTPEFLFTHRFAKLGVDNNGEVYSIAHREVEKLNYETDQFEHIGSIPSSLVSEFTFDKNNNLVIYDIANSPSKIMKLVRSDGTCA